MYCPRCGNELNRAEKYCHNCGKSVENGTEIDEKEQNKRQEYNLQLTGLEIYIRRSLALLLVSSYFLIPILDIGPAFIFLIVLFPFYLLYSFYLLKVKHYHPIFDFLIFLIAFVLFKYSLFFLPAPLPELKGTILAADWTSKYDRLLIDILLGKLIFFTAAVFMLFCDTLGKLKLNIIYRQKAILILFVLILIVSFSLPFLQTVKITTGEAELSWGGSDPSFEPPYKQEKNEMGTFVQYDSNNNTWIYQVKLKNKTSRTAELIKFTSKGKQLVPPFDDNIKVTGGEIIDNRIIVPAGSIVVIKYFSKELLWKITLFETDKNTYIASYWETGTSEMD